jgi:hypothetical protein
VLPVTVTVDRPGENPLELTSTAPFHLTSQITQFPPPPEDQYQLGQPVNFAASDNKVGALEKFPAKIRGL